jgi:hypothetical protein
MASHYSETLPTVQSATDTAIYEELTPHFGSPQRDDHVEHIDGGGTSDREAHVSTALPLHLQYSTNHSQFNSTDNDSAVGDLSLP